MNKISIIGSGFVGEGVGKGLMKLGHEVIFYDVMKKELPNFTDDLSYAVKNSDISFICVPTPSDGEIDLNYIREASKKIGEEIGKKDAYHLVVIKSTVVPKTTESVVLPELEKHSKKNAGEFGLCMNPEFLTEIANTWSDDEDFEKDLFTEDRIVIGELDKRSGNLLEEVYQSLDKPIFRTDLKTAEMIKYSCNCMLATKISYWNEIFLICSELGIDSKEVADIAAIDPRIGKYGTVHGLAFGGKCLPKDLRALISFSEKFKDPILLKAVESINEEIKEKYGVRE
ncbi:MAG: nucleotide sugar dehydrogenase [Halobacteriota archaeon]|nr:nucleotide sugar dehydrogenase [Halobacteriota archaeon]